MLNLLFIRNNMCNVKVKSENMELFQKKTALVFNFIVFDSVG